MYTDKPFGKGFGAFVALAIVVGIAPTVFAVWAVVQIMQHFGVI
jgi:hypothetical protein